jgi:Tol biopolymer transport system component
VALEVGSVLGPYEILAPLGAGGMGRVFRARDSRLGRQVAIKALPEGVAADPERVARFDREARALAALNHPLIGAIYGVEETEAGRVLVLELVEGPTLADRLGRGPLPPDEALRIAGHVATALEAAHEQGIVHRDLKPANVKVRDDGAVKVLDFGLAKAGSAVSSPVLSDSPTGTAEATRDGVILGTAAYMSPEQARGRNADGRTDVWSFGCVLFEMLTGRRAFGGETVSDVIAAVLEREPDWHALPATTPPGVRRLLRRCLEKDPRRRLHQFADVRIEVEEALAARDEAASAGIAPAPGTRRWRALALASSGALVVAAAFMLARLRPAAAPPSSERAYASQLTRLGGSEAYGALAPDGRSFAFSSYHGGTSDIWLRQVSGGEPVRLTNDAALEVDLVYAPDGETLYFVRAEPGSFSVWRIGALGGPARRVAGDAREPAPSPDGRLLAYVGTAGDESVIVVTALDGSATRSLVRGATGPFEWPSWSPDGRRLSYIGGGPLAATNVFVVDVTSGETRQVTRFEKSGARIASQRWLPDGRRIAMAYAAGGSTFQNDLGILDTATGSITRLTLNVGQVLRWLSLSADGSRLVATASETRRELWKVPLGPDPDANGRAAVRLLDDSWDPTWTSVSRDGRTTLFNSAVTGGRNLWTMPLDASARPRQVTAFLGETVTHAALSPDGTRVAFASSATGTPELWPQGVDGSDLRQLTSDGAAASWPAWSPDGHWIAFGSPRDGSEGTWRVPAGGGPPEKVADGLFRGDWASRPDGGGTWMVTSLRGTKGLGLVTGVRLLDPERRAVLWQRELVGTMMSTPTFSPDARLISLPGWDRERSVIWTLDPASGEPRIAVRFPDPVPLSFRASWADQGRALVVNRSQQVSRIVLFDRFWEQGAPKGR